MSNDNIVREVNPLNEDADILITDLELINKSIDEVTELIIDESSELGKLDNDIELIVMNDDEKIRLKLENQLSKKINEQIYTKSYNAELIVKGVTEEMKTLATEYKISNGKMLLVSKALELNDELKEEVLVNLSVKEIQNHIKETSIERREEIKNEKNRTNEEQRQELKRKKEELRQKQIDKKEIKEKRKSKNT